MRLVFADTYFYLALINRSDAAHEPATRFAASFRGTVLTTQWILTELADALLAPHRRMLFGPLVEELRRDRQTIILDATPKFFQAGCELYTSRSDKYWSITDCISFAVMTQHGIAEALTGDRHFQQAGFVPLFA